MPTKGAFHQNKTSNIVKYYYNSKYIFYLKYVIYSSDGKAEFSAAITSVSQDPSKVSLICLFAA